MRSLQRCRNDSYEVCGGLHDGICGVGSPPSQERAAANRAGVEINMKTVAALCLILLSSSAFAATAPNSRSLAPPACDRECLRGMVTQVLYALVEHDTSKLPVAGNLRVTEDGIEKPLAKVGLVRTVTWLRGYRQDVIDE